MAKGTPALDALNKAAIAFTLHRYAYDADAPRIGLQAAEALGIAPARMFKTLMAEAESMKGREIVCALLPSDTEMSLKRLAALAGAKSAAMLKPDLAEKHTGYHVGGISPLGQRKRPRIFADNSLVGFETVFINGGQRGLQIEIAPKTLVDLLAITLGDIAA